MQKYYETVDRSGAFKAGSSLVGNFDVVGSKSFARFSSDFLDEVFPLIPPGSSVSPEASAPD